jgi:hypothetical protein
MSSCVGFVVDKVALGKVFSEYFGFPCQFAFHRLLHDHYLSSGQAVAAEPGGLSLTPWEASNKPNTVRRAKGAGRRRTPCNAFLVHSALEIGPSGASGFILPLLRLRQSFTSSSHCSESLLKSPLSRGPQLTLSLYRYPCVPRSTYSSTLKIRAVNIFRLHGVKFQKTVIIVEP